MEETIMKMTKKLLASVLALSLAACTAMGTISASADEATETELAAPVIKIVEDLSVLDGDIGSMPEEPFLVWLEQNYDDLRSGIEDSETYVDVILKKNDDGTFAVVYLQLYSYDSFESFMEEVDIENINVNNVSKEGLEDNTTDYGDIIVYLTAPTDLADCDVTVDVDAQSVTVTNGGVEIPASDYTVTYFGVDNDYESWEFPAEPGEYSVTVAAKDGLRTAATM